VKRVLVTGGAGFIGRHTLIPLIEHGYDVHVLTSHSSSFSCDNVKVHHANLLNGCGLPDLMKRIRPSHLLHTAWYTENGKFWEAVENVYWLKATLSLVEAFYAEGGERVLGLGTCAEYDWTDGLCVEEETPERPLSLYGKMKKSTYEALSALTAPPLQSFAWARIFFPYGEGEPVNRLIPHVITGLLSGDAVHCTHGNQIRDFLQVADIGRALVAVLDSKVTGAINIGSGIPVKIQEVVNCIADVLERKDLIMFGALPEPAYSPRMILANIDRLKKEVDFTPTFSLKEGLLNTISWWRAEKSEHIKI
jgi:nucleoside-diphosphate-sugar epimerase